MHGCQPHAWPIDHRHNLPVTRINPQRCAAGPTLVRVPHALVHP